MLARNSERLRPGHAKRSEIEAERALDRSAVVEADMRRAATSGPSREARVALCVRDDYYLEGPNGVRTKGELGDGVESCFGCRVEHSVARQVFEPLGPRYSFAAALFQTLFALPVSPRAR